MKSLKVNVILATGVKIKENKFFNTTNVKIFEVTYFDKSFEFTIMEAISGKFSAKKVFLEIKRNHKFECKY